MHEVEVHRRTKIKTKTNQRQLYGRGGVYKKFFFFNGVDSISVDRWTETSRQKRTVNRHTGERKR